MMPSMKPDITMKELWQSKDARSQRFGGNLRSLCLHLMENQTKRQGDHPLVLDLSASRAAHEARIAKLPPPLDGDVLLPDDAILAELREVRASIAAEEETASAVREEPSQYEQKKE